MEKKYTQKAFFSRKFLGMGFHLDFYTPFAHREIRFIFTITLFFFRYWIVLYKE